jgi:acyl-CoA synthetase (AMP-forming)/AMP-acid ligase II
LKTGEQATEEEIIAYCREHLADYKCPKRVYFLDEIPKGPTGKLLKRELQRLVK